MGKDRSHFKLDIDGIQLPPDPYGETVYKRRTMIETLLPGDDDNQFSLLYVRHVTIAASGTLALDLQDDVGPYGDALSMTDIALLFVENVNEEAGGGTVSVAPNASDGLTSVLTDGSEAIVPPGAFFLMGSMATGAYTVGSSVKALDIIETGGIADAVVRVMVWGRTPSGGL